LPALRLLTGHRVREAHFKSRCFSDIKSVLHTGKALVFLPAKDDYRVFLKNRGLRLNSSRSGRKLLIIPLKKHTIYIFQERNGFTGKKYYDIKIDDDYVSAFNDHVNQEIRKESTNGRVKVEFNRCIISE